MKKQLTAVEWLIWELNKLGYFPNGVPEIIYNQAKQMEKYQIINTCEDVDSVTFWVNYRSFEEYYNEKFKN